MRVFVMGATGYIGAAIVGEFLRAGHEVTGLVRSKEGASRLEALGAKAVIGDLRDPSTYRSVAAQHEALIHTAFEFTLEGATGDRTAVDTLLAAAKEGGRAEIVIYTSGTFVLGNTGHEPADEGAPTDHPAELVAWRPAHEQMILDGATDRLATAVIRPGIVYGGKGGTIGWFFETAVKEGAVRYVGDGRNRWSLVHRDDVARLYRVVAEKRARGIFHSVDGAPTRVAEVARLASEAAGKGGATRSLPLEEARKKMGAFADALCLDQVVGARRSAELGWTPAHRSFRESVLAAFEEWRA